MVWSRQPNAIAVQGDMDFLKAEHVQALAENKHLQVSLVALYIQRLFPSTKTLLKLACWIDHPILCTSFSWPLSAPKSDIINVLL